MSASRRLWRRGRAIKPALVACVLLGLGALAGCPGKESDPSKTGGGASPDPAAPAPTTPRGILARVVDDHCLDPAAPWALAHAVLVRGKELRLPGAPRGSGELAVERLVADNLPPGGLVFVRNRGEVPVDAHPGLILKTLQEVGVPPDRAFRTKDGRSVTLEQLLTAARAEPLGTDEPRLRNEAWRLEVLGSTASPELRASALEVLVANQRYFEDYARDPKRPYRKATEGKGRARKPAQIHRYYCGGLHLFQAVQRLHGTEVPPALARQYELLLLRLELETRYWAQAWEQVQRKAPPDLARHRRVILSQRLKLQGHALETYFRALATKALPAPTPEVSKALQAGLDALAATVREIEAAGLRAELPALAKTAPQLYRDLVGDAAHALHAVQLADSLALNTAEWAK